MDDRVLVTKVRNDIKATGFALDAKTEVILNKMDQRVETSPDAIVTVEPIPAVPWYSFKPPPEITTLEDIIRRNDSFGMFDGYGDVFCCFCRAVDHDSPSYDSSILNKHENI
ncbi:hypothetical protein [Pelagibaculum spongiae]|uniref:Uncharacterized protein n=1 Tax=Pelagibaculum spongiae TaxID=2080658 RepID=A0A2V1H5M6_9GAMM|nr:hypothetical protein [Pelagibaculum spongiae]PVZ72507.1 hypothetical protein DC094_05760 [Pelagibaculum spongiae]